ncbi:MAG: hypothetical protein KZQ87_12645, partial [Candidatus Thiodiazotropha sp. (ex Cardiolucina cf. quadrata)]|nr:hypothetical protein [Candidatus Thiodiazotropha sp. (ex Cardiolucina cf. quadrata)]
MRESKLRKIIFLIVALIGLSGILLGLYWNLNGNENYGQISLGFGGGLLAWLLTFLIVNWIDTSRGSHYRNTEEILDVVKEKYLSLKDKERSKLDSSYYESHYALADEVRISGIATKSFVEYLVEGLSEEKLPPSHLLQVMQDRPVTVKVLLMDPGSDVVKMENRRDDPTHGQEHTKVICRVLGHWKAIFEKLSELQLDPNSEIIVRLNC